MASPVPEFRRDPIVGRWVIISEERSRRPSDFDSMEDAPQGGACPFCPGYEDKTPPEILAYYNSGRAANKPGWWVRVIPNKYPALQIEGGLSRRGEGMYDKMNALGAHEIIIETPVHDQRMIGMDKSKLEDVFWAYRDRILDLAKDPQLEYVLIFKNHGSAAGASLRHPHSQLIAMPMAPVRLKQEIRGALKYFEYKERCVYCDVIRQESDQDVRIVSQNDDFIAYTPYASRFPFETWITPKRHSSDFQDIAKGEIATLAGIMKDVLSRQDQVLNNPSFNYILHTAPLKTPKLSHFHWYIEVIPKLTKVAGFEHGTGFYINPTPPEQAAQLLRDAALA